MIVQYNILTGERVELPDELPTVIPEPTILEKLAQLDQQNTLTQRNLRETIMLMTEAIKQATNNTIDLSQIPGVAKVIEVEAEATILRSQL